MDTPQALVKYLQNVTGVAPALAPVPKSRLAGLPVYLAKTFDIRKLEIFGRSILVAIVTSDARIDLAQLAKHRELLAAKLGEEIVLTLPHLKSYERRRLIQKGIPFIAPGRQMYLPMMLVDLRESFPAPVRTTTKTMSWVAQTIVLRHLLSGDIEDRPMAAVALSLGYSAMAVSQAVDELIAPRLCQRVQQGKSKILRFESDPRALWRSALPFMRSPVKKLYLVRKHDSSIARPLRAGMTALAESTNIADGPIKTLALSAKDLRGAIEGGHIQTCSLEEDAEAILQAWPYAPGRLSAGLAVDSLSLYLSLRDDPDERVQIAIEQLVGAWI
jgi:hypothetical protein